MRKRPDDYCNPAGPDGCGCTPASGCKHGWVKNMPDGTVLMVAESSPASLADFIRLARAPAEDVIRVEDIAVIPGAAMGEFRKFYVEW